MSSKKSIIAKLTQAFKTLFERIINYLPILLVIVFAISLVRNVRRTQDANSRISKAEGELKKLVQEQKDLEKKLSEVKSEEFVEKQLRDSLGLSKEGEIVIVLPDPEIVKKFALKIEEEEEILPDPNWKKWVKLFF